MRFKIVTVLGLLGLVGFVFAEEKFTVSERTSQRSVDVSFDFKGAKFADVIDYIAKQSGRNIVIQGEIDDTVTLRLVGVKWRRALDLICQQIGAVIEDDSMDLIRISKPVPISFELENADLTKAVSAIAKMAEATVIIGPNVTGTVTAQFYEVPWTQALDYIVRTTGFVVLKEGKIFRIMDPAILETQLVTRVFQLRYIQPPETYKARIDSKFAEQVKDVERIEGVTGEGARLNVPVGVGGLSGQRARRLAARSSGGASSPFFLLNALKRVASDKGTVEYVRSTNSLIVTDTEPNMKAIAELIETIDREPLQCFIDVKFVSTDLTDRFRFGLDWTNGLTASSTYGSVLSRFPFDLGEGGFEDDVSIRPSGPTAADIAAGITDTADRTGPFTFGLLDFRDMAHVIDVFKEDDKTELKQSPQLLVLDNHQATIFVGETIRFAETQAASNQSGGLEQGIQEAANSPVDTGFQLLVRPHIVAGENKVILTVIPKAESLSGTGNTIPGFDDFTNGTATIQLPRVQSSTLVTKLIIEDGQTAVLGGMIQESNGTIIRKLPLLGDIPVLGWAFKYKATLKTKNNLLVFITVRIVKGSSDVTDIYTVYGGKYGGKAYERMNEEKARKWNKTKEGSYGTKVKKYEREIASDI